MRKFTATEVLDLLNDETTVREYKSWRTKEWTPMEEYSILEDGWTEVGNHRVSVDGEWYEIKSVEQGGGMDEGSNAYVIFTFGEQYFRKDGFYQSHYGYDWDGDFYEVEPYQKTVTDYRRVG